jgi:recombinational DNA repair ATPase RecF
LLLDDVMSELDQARRRYMAKLLTQYPQVFITSTDLNSFPTDFLANAKLIRVEQGRHQASVSSKQ